MGSRRDYLKIVGGATGGIIGGLLGGGMIGGVLADHNTDDSEEDPLPPSTDPSQSGARDSLNVNIERDIVFQETPERDLTLDLYEPMTHAWSPAFIWVHGGGWRVGSKEVNNPRLLRMAEQGHVGIDINYRLSNEAPYPAAVKDVKASIKWLYENAEEYNINTDKIAIAGGSAGAHLATLVANTPGMKKYEPEGYNSEIPTDVEAVIGIYGAYDFTTYQYPPATNQFLGDRMADNPEVYREASPITHVTDNSPPHYLFHGTNDHSVPIEQSYQMEKTLKSHDVDVWTWYPKGHPHGFDDPNLVENSAEECARAEALDRIETFLIAKTPKEDLLSQGKEHGGRYDDTDLDGGTIEGEGNVFYNGNETRSSYFPDDGKDPSCQLENVEAEDAGLNVTWWGEDS